MAKLHAASRNALPSSSFALPGKRAFPIEDKSHAEDALRMKGHASPAEQKEIEAKVHNRFPDVGNSSASVLARRPAVKKPEEEQASAPPDTTAAILTRRK